MSRVISRRSGALKQHSSKAFLVFLTGRSRSLHTSVATSKIETIAVEREKSHRIRLRARVWRIFFQSSAMSVPRPIRDLFIEVCELYVRNCWSVWKAVSNLFQELKPGRVTNGESYLLDIQPQHKGYQARDRRDAGRQLQLAPRRIGRVRLRNRRLRRANVQLDGRDLGWRRRPGASLLSRTTRHDFKP